MLVDEIDITIKAGDGGKGKVSFGKMEKSGPDGGNGGDGGDVYIKATSDLTVLRNYQPLHSIEAPNGGNGGKDKMTGARGEDKVILLPTGTHLKDKRTKEEFELKKTGQIIFLCEGGKGGVGNFDLRSSLNTTPLKTLPPGKGQIRHLKIVLKFIADYGLIGLPSAGKSSLLNELTDANAKTGEYHFTTLSPNLGVLKNEKRVKIIADIPGLIEGASLGKGLGIKFLKHIQKVSLLLHCIESTSNDHLKDYATIRKELGEFDKKLLEKKEIILLSKTDLIKPEELTNIIKKLKKVNNEIIPVSIYDFESINKLREYLI